jgi:uncharacterized RDD family membrane protein YckC
MIYDAFLVLGLCFFATALLLLVRGGVAPKVGDFAYQLYLLFIWICFVLWFWTHGGQTLGMRAWKLRLVSLDNQVVGWRQALLRFFCAFISLAPLGLGYWSAIWRFDRLTWHDRLSNTRVKWQVSE